ncbi:MAG: hypothetical protein MJA30_31365 [Cytophagales bacterium]|nr:hypothetical protein [Cytophagales bacterium]
MQKEGILLTLEAEHIKSLKNKDAIEVNGVIATEYNKDIWMTRLWYCWLGHLSIKVLRKTLKITNHGAELFKILDIPYDTCDLTKSLPYQLQRHFPRANYIL